MQADDKLRMAFYESSLYLKGWTFERAMQCEHTAWSLHHRAKTYKTLAPIGTTPKQWNGTTPKHLLRRTGDTVRCSCGKQFDVGDPDIHKHSEVTNGTNE